LLLVDAAVRHRRRRRVRRTGLRVLVVAAAVALIPVLVHDAPDHEIPAVPPAPRAVTTLGDAFSVFRRGEVPADKAPGSRPGDESRLIASDRDVRAYLLHRGSRLCIATRELHPRDSSLQCGPISLDPKLPLGNFTNRGSTGRIILALPDGVSSVSAGSTEYPVRTNGVIIDVPKWPIDLTWMTPNGPASAHFEAGPAPTAEMLFAALRRPWKPADNLAGFPGARLLYMSADVTAWLIPRRGAVCLQVTTIGARRDTRSGCRHRLDDVRDPIIVAVPHRPQHVVAMVFPDGATSPGVNQDGFRLIREGEEAVNVRYIDPTGTPRVSWFPTSPVGGPEMAAFVLHARAESPSSLEAP
jgi:hypothetical protein